VGLNVLPYALKM